MIKHDYTGLRCPLPVLKAKRIIKSMSEGEELIFISDDPASPIDFQHLCDNENLVMNYKEEKSSFIFRVYKVSEKWTWNW